MADGVPEPLAERLANLELFLSACDVVMLDQTSRCDLPTIGRLYYALGTRLQLGWLRQFMSNFRATSHWDRLAIQSAIGELYDEQRRLSESVLSSMNMDEPVEASLERWMELHYGEVERFSALIHDMRSAEKQDIAMVIVALRQLSSIRGKYTFRE